MTNPNPNPNPIYSLDNYTHLKDFHYYEDSHSQFDYQKPFLLVDSSYVIFYRFFALRTWYSMAHKEKFAIVNNSDEYDWMGDTVFMEKFNKTFLDGILKLLKKYKIPSSNLIFSLDCPSWEIWRHTIINGYKENRKDSHIKSKFYCYKIFAHAEENIIAPFAKLHKSHIARVKNAEGDDINAVLIQHIRQSQSQSQSQSSEIYIVATDCDYIQMCDNNTHLLDIKGKNLSNPKLTPTHCKLKYLITKILVGDKSDEIPPCLISSKFLLSTKILTRNTSKEYTNCSIKLVEKMILDSEIYNMLLATFNSNRNKSQCNSDGNSEDGNNLFKNNQFQINQTLIDFHFIPQSIRQNILNIFGLK